MFYAICQPRRWLQIVLTLCAFSVITGCASYEPDTQAPAEPVTVSVYALPEESDLQDLITYAQSHHPAVRAARESLKRSQAGITEASTWADPQLSVSQGLTDSGWQTVALQQEIPVFNRRQINIARAEAIQRAAEVRVTAAEVQVAEAVQAALAEYLYIQASMEVQRDLISILQQVTAVVQSRYESGSGAMNELLRAQNELDQARSQQQNLFAMQKATQARLNAALGRDAHTPLPQLPDLAQTHSDYALLAADESELYELLATHNPAYAASFYELQALKAGQDLADRAGRPRLMLGLEYMNTDMGDGMPAAMASVSLPIWRSGYRAQREAAAADYAAGQARQQALQLDLEAELSMALYQWRDAERNRQLYGDVLVNRSQQVVASLLGNYQSGTAAFTDVLSSQREWLAFSLNYQRALADQLVTAATINAMVAHTSEVSYE